MSFSISSFVAASDLLNALARVQIELAKQGGDGLVRFGDVVMLQHAAGDALACCADDEDPRSGVNSCGASVSPLQDPVARTTFQLVRRAPHRIASRSASRNAPLCLPYTPPVNISIRMGSPARSGKDYSAWFACHGLPFPA